MKFCPHIPTELKTQSYQFIQIKMIHITTKDVF